MPILKKPEKKDDRFIAKTKEPVKIIFSDIKLKSIRRLIDNKGYNIAIYIPENINNEGITNISKLDDDVVAEIINYSPIWFSKTFTKDDLSEMYTKSYCAQTKTMPVIFTNTNYPKIIYNNNNIDTVDTVISILRENNHYKKCIINIEIEYHGISFYNDNTKNKWVVSSIDITDITNDNNDNNNWINKDDILDKLNDDISLINNKMNKKIIELQKYINELEENKLNINKMFITLKTCPFNNIQEPLNKINQLIIYQESKINNI